MTSFHGEYVLTHGNALSNLANAFLYALALGARQAVEREYRAPFQQPRRALKVTSTCCLAARARFMKYSTSARCQSTFAQSQGTM